MVPGENIPFLAMDAHYRVTDFVDEHILLITLVVQVEQLVRCVCPDNNFLTK